MKRKGRRVALLTGAVAIIIVAITAYLGWPYLRFWYRFDMLGINAQGYPEYRHRQTGIVMVKLPGGTFWMGAQGTDLNGRNFDPEAEDWEHSQEILLNPFLIGKYEVTQGQWRVVMGSNTSEFTGDDNRPVETVSWDDIQEFESNTGLKLPTEAQWEYACRGETKAPFVGKLDDMAWYINNSGGMTHPVGMKAPNGFGLHDTLGNVWEWCEDVCAARVTYSITVGTGFDPVNMAGSRSMVTRGGCWENRAGFCRASFLCASPPSTRISDFGFRVAHPYP